MLALSWRLTLFAAAVARAAMIVTTDPATMQALYDVNISTGVLIKVFVNDNSDCAEYECNSTCTIGWARVESWGGQWYDSATVAADYTGEYNGLELHQARLHPSKIGTMYEFYAYCTDGVRSAYSSSVGGNGRFVTSYGCGDGIVQSSLGEECDPPGVYRCTSTCKCQAGLVASATSLGCEVSGRPLPSTTQEAKWRKRSIYQVFTDRFQRGSDSTRSGSCTLSKYCGGTFLGIKEKLGYITGMGFDAIYISPVLTNTEDGYHGFWAKNFSEINPEFGGESGLTALIAECRKRDVLLMIDWVSNHVGPVSYNYERIFPFSSSSHYHSCRPCPTGCEVTDYTNQSQAETCRLSGLPDLNQTVPYVAEKLAESANWLIGLGAEGLRIDTAPHVAVEYWQSFRSNVSTFMMGEIWDSSEKRISTYQPPLDSALWYPMFYALRNAFLYKDGDISLIAKELNASRAIFKDTTILGNFVDNHDNPRFLSTQSDTTLYRNALVAIALGEGIPLVYYGSEQGLKGNATPANREPLWDTGFSATTTTYQTIGVALKARKTARVWEYKQETLYLNSTIYGFTHGAVMVFLRTDGSSAARRTITFFPLSGQLRGTYYDQFNTSNKVYVPTLKLSVSVTLPAGGEPQIYLCTSCITPEATESSSKLPTSVTGGASSLSTVKTLFLLFALSFSLW